MGRNLRCGAHVTDSRESSRVLFLTPNLFDIIRFPNFPITTNPNFCSSVFNYLAELHESKMQGDSQRVPARPEIGTIEKQERTSTQDSNKSSSTSLSRSTSHVQTIELSPTKKRTKGKKPLTQRLCRVG